MGSRQSFPCGPNFAEPTNAGHFFRLFQRKVCKLLKRTEEPRVAANAQRSVMSTFSFVLYDRKL